MSRSLHARACIFSASLWGFSAAVDVAWDGKGVHAGHPFLGA